MSRTTAPNCNRSFIIEALLGNKRMDGRSLHQFRDLQVNFGRTFGSVYLQLGQTVVLASTAAVIDEPRLTRPAEGRFKVTMNIGAGGKDRWLKSLERSQPTEAVLAMRLLEKIINRINVLDLESLCLVVGKVVWAIETSIVLLNYDGNLVEAASIATIASLMHFRRPDATVTPDGDIIVHSLEERSPIPLTLFHLPLCVTFQFMDSGLLRKLLAENYQEGWPEELVAGRLRKVATGRLMITDPTEEEEEHLRNVLVVCANTYGEIVAIQSLGRISLSSSGQLLKECTRMAFERVRFVTDYLKAEIAKQEKEQNNSPSSFEGGFFEALRQPGSLELCIARDYRRSAIFGSGRYNGFTMPAADEDLSVTNSTKNSTSKATEEDLSLFLRSHRQANKIGEGGLSKWGLEPALDFHDGQGDEEGEEGDEDEEAEDGELEDEEEQPNTNSYANILGPRRGTQQQQQQQQQQRSSSAKTSTSENSRPQQPPLPPQHQFRAPPKQKQQPKPAKATTWTKVESNKMAQAEAQKKQQLQQLSKSQKKKLKKREKEAAAAEMAKWGKKVASRISDDEDEEEEGEVVELKSEYQR
ncbi:Exosome complex component RRP45 [Tyrophagus putrescentiae]|nr:Exosome complex component RRP45 [Tyrophagus putrescentiae]